MRRTLCALVLAACGPSPAAPDAAPDGMCGAELFFTGEYLDWDAADTRFCRGVFQATWQDHDDARRTFATNPNGRFELCVPAGARIDITPAAGPAPCNNMTYATKGIAIVDAQAIGRGALFSARTFSIERAKTFFTGALGSPAGKAHVFVHLATAAKVSTTAAHDPAQVYDGNAWAAGDTGTDVVLPNLDPAAGTATISIAGGRTLTLPIAADTISYASP